MFKHGYRRVGKQCRERFDFFPYESCSTHLDRFDPIFPQCCMSSWFNRLDPAVRTDPWTPEEDAIILSLHGKIGNKWTEIASHLQGRPPNAVKNRWHSTLGRRAGLQTTAALERSCETGSISSRGRKRSRSMSDSIAPSDSRPHMEPASLDEQHETRALEILPLEDSGSPPSPAGIDPLSHSTHDHTTHLAIYSGENLSPPPSIMELSTLPREEYVVTGFHRSHSSKFI